MEGLRKDDPIYYRNKIRGLINQAMKEGLEFDTLIGEKSIHLVFKADNGDKSAVVLPKGV